MSVGWDWLSWSLLRGGASWGGGWRPAIGRRAITPGSPSREVRESGLKNFGVDLVPTLKLAGGLEGFAGLPFHALDWDLGFTLLLRVRAVLAVVTLLKLGLRVLGPQVLFQTRFTFSGSDAGRRGPSRIGRHSTVAGRRLTKLTGNLICLYIFFYFG
jgi:hypothetical protein